ncbi:MAG: 4Fe-4S dicluster domain-containing protein, partial [Flavobacteriales bacterium]
AVTENEGNALMSIAFPKIHIVIAGIEKVIPSISDLDLFWPLLATHGTGQNITVYNSIMSGPRLPDEIDGPEEMYVILLDNGRSNLLAQTDQRQALYCIRCGACLNGCPIYKGVGGHAYGATYSGPIGSVITPHYQGMKEFKHLSYASSLCGKCTEVCPVRIDLHKLLLYNRRDSVNQHANAKPERWTYTFWKKAMLSRRLMNQGGARAK